MPFGILDDHKLDTVPGTELLSAKGNELTTGDASKLKRGSGKYSHIVLIPQPSNDPHDPLNWHKWRKEACFWTLVFLSSIADTLLFLANPGYFLLAKELDVSVDEVASSFSAAYAGVAIFILLQIPISVKYGHRIVFLLSTFLMTISCVWVALSPNLTSIRASRVFQGMGAASGRCLVVNAIEALYFVHERGSRSCIWIMCQGIGEILGLLINGYVIQLLSWRFGFWFASVACGLCCIGVLFFVPETTYRRQASPKQGYMTDDEDCIEKTGPRVSMSTSSDDIGPKSSLANPPTALSYLKIYNGTFSDESVWRIFIGFFPFILSPVTWFSLASFSIPAVLVGFVATCSSTIFSMTYGFDARQIGLTNVGGIVGIVFAMVTAGPLSDWWIVWMSRRNRGVYEPEFRLFFMFSLLLGAFSYLGWAIGNNRHMPWIGAVACLAMSYFSAVVSSAARTAYVIDTHGPNASYIMALTEFVPNIVTYGSTFFANGVVLSAGVRRTLLLVAVCQAACWLACVPMYVFGKRVRSFIARHPRLFRGDLPAPSDSGPGSHPAASLKRGPDSKL